MTPGEPHLERVGRLRAVQVLLLQMISFRIGAQLVVRVHPDCVFDHRLRLLALPNQQVAHAFRRAPQRAAQPAAIRCRLLLQRVGSRLLLRCWRQGRRDEVEVLGRLRIQRLVKTRRELDAVLVKRQSMAERLDRIIRFREWKRLRDNSH